MEGDMGAVKMYKIIGISFLTVKLEFNVHLKGMKLNLNLAIFCSHESTHAIKITNILTKGTTCSASSHRGTSLKSSRL